MEIQQLSHRSRTSVSAPFLVILALLGLTIAASLGALSGRAEPVPVSAGVDGETGGDIMEDLVARESQPPRFLDEELADASLTALSANGMLGRIAADPDNLSDRDATRMAGQQNGADTADVLVPIVHFIDCALETCPDAIGWAEQRQLDVSEPVQSQGHGGVDEFHIEVFQVVPATGRAIAVQADRIYRGVESLNDATVVYAGWAPNTEDARS